jgi:hypothetical protein
MNTIKYYLSVAITVALFTSAFGFSVGACDTGEDANDALQPLTQEASLIKALYVPSFDLGGELIQEEWFDLDKEPIRGEDGWHRVEYIRDPRGLIIEEIGYGLDGEPANSPVLGYSVLLIDYDDHGREVYAGYFDAVDEPALVTRAALEGDTETPRADGLSFHATHTDHLDDITYERTYLNPAGSVVHRERVDLFAGFDTALPPQEPRDPFDTDCEVDGDPEALLARLAMLAMLATERPMPADPKPQDKTAAVEPDLEKVNAVEEEECGCGDDDEGDNDTARRLEESADLGHEGCYDEGDCDEGMDCDDEADRDDESACDYRDVDCDDEEGCFEGLECDEGQENCWDSPLEEEIADCGYEGCHDLPISALHDIADRLGLAIGEALELGYPQAPDAQPRAKEAKPEPETLESETSADDPLQPEGWSQEEDLESDEWMQEEDLEDEAWMHDDPDEPGC